MKRLILTIIIALFIGACTENQHSEKITLPKGERLVTAIWKEDKLWYLTEQMPEGYTPQTRTFQVSPVSTARTLWMKEKSSFGTMEGTVIFYESK